MRPLSVKRRRIPGFALVVNKPENNVRNPVNILIFQNLFIFVFYASSELSLERHVRKYDPLWDDLLRIASNMHCIKYANE